ncbi:alpha/beta fold hydrolase [Undibacterium oligocarboniphilum]|uniref:Alpha/beta hydrolase n=1 Tax=Undibacterium oligocarboniphilum TaxID=666702 RepID=A0A850QA10_9BURK|nr:alpha/beta hydrolase [Undibacterium oligocarboniphilum]MBC3870986.1 alpha/beta hydrolase [Undibacterium oligocarboniphilum]NVO76391.1 alpha/beta hydrolase [Undibacterium oligocarboniphilum]
MRLRPRLSLILLCLLMLLMGGLFLTLALVWAPDKSVEELKPKWAPPPSQFIQLQGQSVHVRDEGWQQDPVPVLLIHGTSSSLHTWEPWVAGLKSEHRVITMDLPGFGLTGPNADGDYSDTVYTRFILSLMDALHLKRVILGGNSLGGEIAWQVAAAAPQRVEKLILVDAAGYPLTPLSVPPGFRIARIPALAWLMDYCLPRVVIERSVRDVFGNPEKVTSALVDRYEAMLLRAGNRRALRQRLSQLNTGGDVEQIRQIHVPTLILWGGKDRLIPPDNALRFQQEISGSKLIMFDELGHVPQEEGPVVTLAAVRIFLQ